MAGYCGLDFLQCSSDPRECLAQVLRCWKGLSDPQHIERILRVFLEDLEGRRERGAFSAPTISFKFGLEFQTFFFIPKFPDGPSSEEHTTWLSPQEGFRQGNHFPRRYSSCGSVLCSGTTTSGYHVWLCNYS